MREIEDTHSPCTKDEFGRERRREGGGGGVENSRYVIVFPIFLEKFVWMGGRRGEGAYKTSPPTVTTPTVRRHLFPKAESETYPVSIPPGCINTCVYP